MKDKPEIERKHKIALLIIIVLMEKMRRNKYTIPFSPIIDGAEVCSWVVRAGQLRKQLYILKCDKYFQSNSVAHERGEEMIKTKGGKVFLIANNPKMIKMPQPLEFGHSQIPISKAMHKLSQTACYAEKAIADAIKAASMCVDVCNNEEYLKDKRAPENQTHKKKYKFHR